MLTVSEFAPFASQHFPTGLQAAATSSRSSDINQHLVNTCSCISSRLATSTTLASVSGHAKERLKCPLSTEVVELHFL